MLSLDQTYGSKLRSGLANTGNQPLHIQFDAEVARPFEISGMSDFERGVAVVNLGDRIFPVRGGSGIASARRNGGAAPQFFRRA
jgi:hypothetical protein